MMMSGPALVSMADAIRGFRSFMLIWSTVTSTPASFPNSAARRLNSTSEAGTKLTHSRTLSLVPFGKLGAFCAATMAGMPPAATPVAAPAITLRNARRFPTCELSWCAMASSCPGQPVRRWRDGSTARYPCQGGRPSRADAAVKPRAATPTPNREKNARARRRAGPISVHGPEISVDTPATFTGEGAARGDGSLSLAPEGRRDRSAGLRHHRRSTLPSTLRHGAGLGRPPARTARRADRRDAGPARACRWRRRVVVRHQHSQSPQRLEVAATAVGHGLRLGPDVVSGACQRQVHRELHPV